MNLDFEIYHEIGMPVFFMQNNKPIKAKIKGIIITIGNGSMAFPFKAEEKKDYTISYCFDEIYDSINQNNVFGKEEYLIENLFPKDI